MHSAGEEGFELSEFSESSESSESSEHLFFQSLKGVRSWETFERDIICQSKMPFMVSKTFLKGLIISEIESVSEAEIDSRE